MGLPEKAQLLTLQLQKDSFAGIAGYFLPDSIYKSTGRSTDSVKYP